jgi:hypothetical protein
VKKLTEQETARLICIAAAAYPLKKELTDEQQDDQIYVWRMVLNEIPYKLAEAALIKTLSTTKFFPAPAEIREAAISLIPGPPSAEEAWEEVRKIITSGHCSIEHQYNSWKPEWSNELIGKTVNEMGLREMFESENISITMAQFKKYYDNNKARYKEKRLNEQILRLTGASKLITGGPNGLDAGD